MTAMPYAGIQSCLSALCTWMPDQVRHDEHKSNTVPLFHEIGAPEGLVTRAPSFGSVFLCEQENEQSL